ncbi:hypothetical protein S7335_587 [Synechococcus sp. PCC 7335]|uniref:hypothetical protein n=1 Tax=Synechococcus sp. (strain ATCC 29403 / PCC 7335) TaxID=91464 RepID=UPI00017EC09C|nr:hypothetical protein [Synechococcus sp. PCC 7335]EDX83407.1 hypothetical protein S7335_587 [Synechococcus sp. PCC 7335]
MEGGWIEKFSLRLLFATEPIEIDAESLTVMPAAWRSQLHQAAVRVDAEIIYQLVEQIPANHHALAERLSKLTQRFDFDAIIELSQPE